jgi:hypothetical protein
MAPGQASVVSSAWPQGHSRIGFSNWSPDVDALHLKVV